MENRPDSEVTNFSKIIKYKGTCNVHITWASNKANIEQRLSNIKCEFLNTTFILSTIKTSVSEGVTHNYHLQ